MNGEKEYSFQCERESKNQQCIELSMQRKCQPDAQMVVGSSA